MSARQLMRRVNVAKQALVKEFVAVLKKHHKRGEALVSVREVMKALGSPPEDIVTCWQELREAGVHFHHTDLKDPSLPTVGNFSYIGANYKPAAAKK